ncbi:MAG: hypothetical protein QXL01_07755, partial [Thermoplasmatales archaeon]
WHYIHCLNPMQETLAGPVRPNNQSAFWSSIIYYSVRAVKIVPQQFRLEDTLTVQGIWGQGTTMFNIAGHYLDGEKEGVHVSEHDLVVFNSNMTDLVRQKFEFNPNGPQQLHYKAISVDHLRDSHGNFYNEGVDFIVQNGKIVWLKNGRKPGFHNGKGDILSIVYWYNPIYIVVQRPHSLRVIPSNPQGHGAFPRDKVYAPQLLVVRPSTIYYQDNIINFSDIPPTPEYADSKNTTGGSI